MKKKKFFTTYKDGVIVWEKTGGMPPVYPVCHLSKKEINDLLYYLIKKNE